MKQKAECKPAIFNVKSNVVVIPVCQNFLQQSAFFVNTYFNNRIFFLPHAAAIKKATDKEAALKERLWRRVYTNEQS
jgi:hypothetical protein